MSQPTCPKCGRTYEAPARYCIRDGTPLRGTSPLFGPRTSPRRTDLPRRSSGGPASPGGGLHGRLLANRYRIEERVGEGGMAYVYRATDTQSGGPVAIKVLVSRLSQDADANARFQREADLACRLHHPNVCPILDQGETDGMRWLVMPFLEGKTLDLLERTVGAVPIARGMRILRALCEGLHHAHGLGVLHRDLKPENVMVVPLPNEDERVVVMDFGLAKAREAGPDLARLTETGIVLGTPEFMSPEQVRGKTLDPRSDIYALGVLAFEMFSGELPFEGETAQETMLNHLTGSPRMLSEVLPTCPPALELALARAFAHQPEDRFATMAEFGKALADISLDS